MRILRIIPSMNPNRGGPCQGIRNSIPVLQELGVYNEVVCFDDENVSFLTNDSFKITPLGDAKTSWAYNDKLVSWLLINLARFDIVIIHGLWQYHGYATVKVFEKYKRKYPKQAVPKLYLMPHGMLDPWFQKEPTRKLKALRNEVYWRLVEKKTVNYVDGLLFTCEQELLLARTTFKGYAPKKELNVGYGILAPPAYCREQIEAFQLKCDKRIDKQKYWLFLSRIHFKKGVDMLLKAYLSLIKDIRYNSLDIPILVIAGPGLESEYGQSLLNFVNGNSELKEKVIFTGMLSGDAKWGAIYGCEAFVLPSHQENYGIAVVEALACSRPVLISNQVNIWKEIESVHAGIISEDSVEGTFEIIKTFINLSSVTKTKMGKQAEYAYSTFFDVKVTSKKLIDSILGL